MLILTRHDVEALLTMPDAIDAVEAGFRQLAAGSDVLLGPAADGGYVLIGLNRPAPTLFQNIAWGTPTVLEATRRRLRRAGLNWAELPVGWDVDTPADLQRLRRIQTRSAAPK